MTFLGAAASGNSVQNAKFDSIIYFLKDHSPLLKNGKHTRFLSATLQTWSVIRSTSDDINFDP